jgi:hypothetical protein
MATGAAKWEDATSLNARTLPAQGCKVIARRGGDMSKLQRRMAVVLATLMLGATSVVVPTSAGAPGPPAPGNGGGASGQCTGPQDDRPSNCNSKGGPGDQP